MMKIYLLTGTAFTKPIEVRGQEGDDLISLIDEYYRDKGYLPVPMYTVEELWKEFEQEEYGEEELDMQLEQMLPINGGEYYIEGISHVVTEE